MRLYTDNADERDVLLHALRLLEFDTSSNYERNICRKLIARIEKCQELQRPENGRKGKMK